MVIEKKTRTSDRILYGHRDNYIDKQLRLHEC